MLLATLTLPLLAFHLTNMYTYIVSARNATSYLPKIQLVAFPHQPRRRKDQKMDGAMSIACAATWRSTTKRAGWER